MNPKGRIGELVVTTSRLVELLNHEVAAVQAGRTPDLDLMQADKARLLQTYEAGLEELRKEPALFAAAAPAMKDELIQAAQRLDRAIARNLRALELARGVNRRLMDAIIEAAAEEQTRGRGYARKGRIALPARPGRTEAVSIAIDQRL